MYPPYKYDVSQNLETSITSYIHLHTIFIAWYFSRTLLEHGGWCIWYHFPTQQVIQKHGIKYPTFLDVHHLSHLYVL